MISIYYIVNNNNFFLLILFNKYIIPLFKYIIPILINKKFFFFDSV